MDKKPAGMSAILSLALFLCLSALSFISAKNGRPLLYAKLIWSLVVSCACFFIYKSGKISKYRSALFVLMALSFLAFKHFRPAAAMLPYCHIAMAPTLSNFLYSQFLAIASGQWMVWGVLTLGFAWLVLIFTIGQGICSWVCFYGGLDEACSKIARKPILKIDIPKPWRDFPIAFLIFLLIVSFLQGLPVFCTWFCPFKMTEVFWASYPPVRIVQAVLFWTALAGFVVIFPILTKKRTFCSLICPFGALATLCSKASLYKVSINPDKCTKCGRCGDVCPVFAIESGDGYRVSDFCNKCGRCMDICPAGAIGIYSGPGAHRVDARDLFIFLALLLAGVVSGLFVPHILLKLAGF